MGVSLREQVAACRERGLTWAQCAAEVGCTYDQARDSQRTRGSESKPRPMAEAEAWARGVVERSNGHDIAEALVRAVTGSAPVSNRHAPEADKPFADREQSQNHGAREVMGRVGKRSWPSVGATAPGRYRVAHVGDIHFGSKHCDAKALLDFLRFAADRGCTVYVQTGDVCDGTKKVLVQEQRAVGYDDQHTEAVEVIAQAPKLPWLVIGGNHDAYSNDEVGMDSGVVLARRMREHGIDWHYLGSCLGRAVIHGAKWELFHPHGAGSTANAIRRTLNAKAEKYEPGDKPDVLAIGHFHKFARVHTDPENIFAIASGTFQRRMGSDFAKRMINPWDIGSSIVSWSVYADGSVGEFHVEFFRNRSEALGWETAVAA